jgi:signal transduction histidine kinase
MTSPTLFTKARFKLTLYYVIIFMILSGIISGLFYVRTSQVLEAEYERMERRFQLEISGLLPSQGPRMIIRRIQSDDLAIAKQKIIIQLLSINGLILLLVSVSGYILSGFTLAPIEASMQQQQRFISDIAHEIKTPLTALKTSLEVNLMDKKIPPNFRSLLNENLQDVTHLDQLTTSMLKLSKNHQQSLDANPVLVAEIVSEAIRLSQKQAKAKRIDINNNVIDPTIQVCGDKVALIDAVKIIIDNAIKYSPKSTVVSISVSTHRHLVKIKIKDQGYGISKKDAPYLFDRFYRVDTSRAKDKAESGYGLGLSIAKTIVEFHRGTISVTSSPGKGSAFLLTFPRHSQ